MNAQNQIVKDAMNLFWKRGAEVASYNDIVEATGLSRKSLYAHWPDKGALINDTLDVYYLQLLDFVHGLTEPGGRDGLKAFWDGFETVSQEETWRGCYLYRTASGPLRETPHVAEIYRDYFGDFTGVIERNIRLAQIAGEIDNSIDAEIAGLQCFALIGSISAIGAQSGYDGRVKKMFDAARASCGVLE